MTQTTTEKAQTNDNKQFESFQKWQNTAKSTAKQAAVKFKDDSGTFGSTLFIAFGVIILSAIAWKVFAINIRPYAIVMGDTLPAPSKIPLIGWGWDLLNIAYYCTGAFLAWGITQFFQASWIAISLDRKALRTAIRKSRKELDSQSTEGSKTDSTTRRESRRLSKIPFAYRYWSAYLAIGFFVVEVIVNLKAYSPVAPDKWGEFWLKASIGDYSLIDWGNIGQLLWSLFSTELVVVAIVIFWQWISHRNEAD
jgi:hypothetical protein